MKFHKTIFLGASLMLAMACNSTVSASVFFWDATYCSVIGNWDEPTQTCTMTADYEGSIEIPLSGVTLDGAGHTVIFSDGPRRIYIGGNDNTIKNLNIISTGQYPGFGIVIIGGDNNTISNVTTSRTTFGVSVRNGSNGNTISNNNFSRVQYVGVEINDGSSANNVTGNTISTDYPAADRYCNLRYGLLL